MILTELLAAIPDYPPPALPPLGIRAVVCDSRAVGPGDLFVAVVGLTTDGHNHVLDAIRRGAVAAVGQRRREEIAGLPDHFPYAQTPDSRLALAWLAAASHDFPARKMRMIGVTGTDGKTTTTNLIYSILSAAGIPAGMISTVNARIGGQTYDTGLHTTTPEALDVQRYLAQMAAAGSQTAVLETTSHGLAQHRVSACEFDIGVVTNITHEHLDFHGSPAAYRAAKAMLFEDVSRSTRKAGVPKVAILNADDSSYELLRVIPADLRLSYAIEAPADLRAEDILATEQETRFTAVRPRGRLAIVSPLVGYYNVYNLLAATAAGLALGLEPAQIRAGVAALTGLPGRMERIEAGQPFTLIVDFAHTPNALRQALAAARRMTRGRLTVVFGCAGLRDVQKRPLMGRAAGELADRTILTAEDPRTEDLRQINAQIVAGYRQAGRQEDADLLQIDDRAEAIARAVALAEPGDLVILCGKGHEQSLCFGTVERPWSDHEAARQGLRQLGYG
jgi:UDP-N-acetylmuramoyl-L-alanyl-D-glutamate--2,6-diaminopimelate ligase